MGADTSTIAAVAALAVAFVALIVAFAQALQQYIVSGQLIRICDSVVYGKLPGQGHRVWQFSQFRFRVVYSIPQISLSPSLWLGISSHVQASDPVSRALPDLKVSSSRKNQLSTAGEASWVSFTRAVQHSCGQSLRYRMVEGDADRCPADLPVAPMQLSMRDVVVAAIMAGMDCTDVSFQSQSLSMQGDAGTITSSRHPVLGALIHFAPKQPYDDHSLRVNNGAISPDWIARMVDTVTVAGCRYDARDRKHFEEDESSWVKSSSDPTMERSEGQNLLPTPSALRRRRRTSSDQSEPDRTRQDSRLGEQSLVLIGGSEANFMTALHRPHDGAWSLVAEVEDSPRKSVGDQEFEKPQARLPQREWFNSLFTYLNHTLRKVNLHSSSARSDNVLPVAEPKVLSSQQLSSQPAATESSQDSHNESATTSFMKTKVEPEQPASTYPRIDSLTAYIAKKRQVEIDIRDKDTAQNPGTKRLYLRGKGERDRLQEVFENENHAPSSLDGNGDRTEYVVNKWQEIFKQRRKNRSRGRAQGNEVVLSQRRMPRSGSTMKLSLGTIASKGARLQNERRQFRLKTGQHKSSVDSEDLAYALRQSRPERISSTGTIKSTSEQQERVKKNHSQKMYKPSAQRKPDHMEMRSHDKAQHSEPEISEDGAEHVSGIPRRGRRRNSSLAREGNKLKVLEYGSSPVRSDHSQPRPDDIKHSTESVSQRKPPRRRVRMVSPGPQDSTIVEQDPRADASRKLHETKGILRRPTQKFPEYPESYRDGVAPLRSSENIPPNARWTKIMRTLVSPEALDRGSERFEERQDCVIVLRVLTKAEIEQYALKTQELRSKFWAPTFDNFKYCEATSAWKNFYRDGPRYSNQAIIIYLSYTRTGKNSILFKYYSHWTLWELWYPRIMSTRFKIYHLIYHLITR